MPHTSPARTIVHGSLGFCLASLIVFASVAFLEGWMYRTLGLYGAYFVWTVLFIGLGGGALRPLAGESVSTARFYLVFAIGFFLYALGWMSAYFTMRGTAGEWAGSFVGSVLLGLTFSIGLRARDQAFLICTVLFIANSLGYFVGSALNQTRGGNTGMLLWGLAYGLFLGAGFGIATILIQRKHMTPRQGTRN